MNFIEKYILISLIPLGLFTSCSEKKTTNVHFNDLGEILFDSQIDDQNFLVCHEDITFPFNYGGVGLVYEGEKRKLVNTFNKKYSFPKTKGETGYVIIRFIINCQGEAGRYRVTEMAFNLKKTELNQGITQQLLNITKGLDGWKPHVRNKRAWDYQQYLTFKIVDGELIKILP